MSEQVRKSKREREKRLIDRWIDRQIERERRETKIEIEAFKMKLLERGRVSESGNNK